MLWLNYAAGSVSCSEYFGEIIMLILFGRFATGAFFNISASPVLPDLAEGAQRAKPPPPSLGDAILTLFRQGASCK